MTDGSRDFPVPRRQELATSYVAVRPSNAAHTIHSDDPVRRHRSARRIDADEEIFPHDKDHAEDLRKSESKEQAEPEDLPASLHDCPHQSSDL